MFARDVSSWLTIATAEGVELEPGETPLDQEDVEAMITGIEKLERDQGEEPFWEPATDLWMPRDPDAAMLQSSLDEYYRRNDAVALDPNIFGEMLSIDPLVPGNVGAFPSAADRARGHFTLNGIDPRWLLFIYAKAVKLFHRGRPNFPATNDAPIPLADNPKMVLFGDWASGIPHAVRNAREMWNSHLYPDINNGRELHAIHLGDTYYAGLNCDYRTRAANWPVPLQYAGQVASWTIPGNHDVYSGGHGFLKWIATDPRFLRQNMCSYFLLENKHWQIFGLDSAYDAKGARASHGIINAHQMNWIAQQRARAPQKKCIVLTHHQPFSAFENVYPTLPGQLAPLANAKQITAWFWGHEHSCGVFQPHNNIPFPILLGHAGFPERRKAILQGSPTMDFDWDFVDGQGFIDFGFAVLDFQDDEIDVRLIDLDGNERYHFVIR